jgi:hypothetical protein
MRRWSLAGWLAGRRRVLMRATSSFGFEGLHDVVVGARFEALHDVGGVGAGGQHDDRHTRLGAHAGADLDAVHAGEHEVEEDEIGPFAAPRIDRLRAVCTEHGVESLGAQHDADHLGEGGVIVDHQDA